MDRLCAGADDDTWRQFVTLYGPLVFRLGQRKGLDPQACETLVQDVCIRAVEKLPRFRYQRDRGRFRNWVLTVALNELRQGKRAEDARQRALDAYGQRGADTSMEGEELEAWWADAEHKRALDLALGTVRDHVGAEKFRVFQLTVLEECPVAEVAAACGLTKAAVSLIKFRVTKRICAMARDTVRSWDAG